MEIFESNYQIALKRAGNTNAPWKSILKRSNAPREYWAWIISIFSLWQRALVRYLDFFQYPISFWRKYRNKNEIKLEKRIEKANIKKYRENVNRAENETERIEANKSKPERVFKWNYISSFTMIWIVSQYFYSECQTLNITLLWTKSFLIRLSPVRPILMDQFQRIILMIHLIPIPCKILIWKTILSKGL